MKPTEIVAQVDGLANEMRIESMAVSSVGIFYIVGSNGQFRLYNTDVKVPLFTFPMNFSESNTHPAILDGHIVIINDKDEFIKSFTPGGIEVNFGF